MAYGANYSFVIDSHFQPFSLQEMLTPFAAYKEAFEKSEADFAALTDKADKFKYLSETLPEGSKARQLYEGYANELHAQANDLSKYGLGMGNRRALSSLKKRYQGEIGRLADADAIKKEQIKEQRDILAKDPTRILSRRADLTSLDDYLDNPNLSYETYSGALLTQQVSAAASAIGKSLREFASGKPLDKFTSTWLQQHGYSVGEVAEAINNPNSPNAPKVLTSLVRDAVASSGIAAWGDQDALNKAYSYARQGLWSAVGETKAGTYENFGERLKAQTAADLYAAKQKMAMQAALQQQQQQMHGTLTPRALRSQKEIQEQEDKLKRFETAGYIKKKEDGTYEITKNGEAAYREWETFKDNPIMSGKNTAKFVDTTMIREQQRRNLITDFYNMLNSENGGALYSDRTRQTLYKYKNFEEYARETRKNPYFKNATDAELKKTWNAFKSTGWEEYVEDARKKGNEALNRIAARNNVEAYDTHHTTEWVRQLDDTYSKEVQRQVMAVPNGSLQMVEFNGNEFAGKNIKNDKLKGFTPATINYSKYGTTITWVDEDGNNFRTMAPKSINERSLDTVHSSINTASDIMEILNAGKMPKQKVDKDTGKVINERDASGHIMFTNTDLTADHVDVLTREWQEAMDNVNMAGSQYVVPSTTKNEEYVPIYW